MFKSIKTVLNDLVKDMGIGDEIEGNRVFVVWDEVVGDVVAKNAQPQFFRKGMLFIETTSSVWAQELSMMRHCLIDALNERLERSLIREIRFKATATEKMSLDSGGKIAPSVPGDPGRVELEPKDLAEIEMVVKNINDTGIREELKKLIVADKKRKKAKPKVR